MRGARLLALVVLAGCGREDQKSPARAEAPKPAALVATAKKPVGRAILESDGLRFDGPGGKTGQFAFGAARGQVEAFATRRFGKPARTANSECGAGPMAFSRYGPLTLNFQGERLVGWRAEPGAEVITADGISAGKLMRDLKVARSAHPVPGSTLEGEFTYIAADGKPIGGFATGEGREARVASLYAGTNCFFR